MMDERSILWVLLRDQPSLRILCGFGGNGLKSSLPGGSIRGLGRSPSNDLATAVCLGNANRLLPTDRCLGKRPAAKFLLFIVHSGLQIDSPSRAG
jgi:hypothetical protein